MHDDVVVPEVTAWRVGRRYKIWCPGCEREHVHDATGWQEARCQTYTECVPTGYILVEGRRFHPSKTVYLSRKL
jgi:hypothetical protein